MSFLHGLFHEYVVTKTGYLVAILEGSGINLDLLSEYEQTDVFEEYNAFLMSHVAESKGEVFQFLDMTVPVDFRPYVLSWKKRYLDFKSKEPNNKVVANLIASYVNYYEEKESESEMTTQEHYIVLREKIKDKHLKSLEIAESNLTEKAEIIRRSLETQFQHYDLKIRKLNGNECKTTLHLFLNFNKN